MGGLRVCFEHVHQLRQRLDGGTDASHLRACRGEPEVVLPSRSRRGEVSDVHRGEAELEMHLGSEWVGAHCSAQLVNDLVTPVERSE